MIHPKGNLSALVMGSLSSTYRVSTTASVFGWIAMLLAVLFHVVFLIGGVLQRKAETADFGHSLQSNSFVAALFLINFFGTFSQVLSSSRESRGSWGMLWFWGSLPLLLALDWLLSR